MMFMEAQKTRVPTGIMGLDKLTHGGVIKGTTTLVSGNAGTGKTIALLQFVHEGLKREENGLLISLEENPEELKLDALEFGWDFDKYEKEGKCKIVRFTANELEELTATLDKLIRLNNYKRIAIDSSSVFGMYKQDTYKLRKILATLVETLKKEGATAMMSAEMLPNSEQLSRHGIEEFVADNAIALYYNNNDDGPSRKLAIKKMRRTEHPNGYFPMKITNKGIEVLHIV